MAEAPFDLARAQKWFAVEFNNTAWDLLDKPGRIPEETERMLHAAHASVLHWLAAGNELNRLRGAVLLANVYAGAGLAEGARRYAEQALALSDAAGDSQTLFDRAAVLACAARACSVADDTQKARQYLDQALAAAASLETDDRTVFNQLCPQL